MKTPILTLALFAAATCFGGSVTITQADACLGMGNCSGAPSGTITNSGGTNTFSESALAQYGILHVTASSTFNVTNSWALSLGNVTFVEDLTINSLTHNGQAGQLNFGYYIDGTNTTTGAGNAFLQVVVRKYAITDTSRTTPLTNYVHDFNGASVNGSFVNPTPIPFIYGSPFQLYVSMQATAGSVPDDGSGGYQLINTTASGFGASNFYNTLIVNQLQTDVTDSTFTSGSGTTYTQDGVVPEPGTFALLGLAAPLVLWRFRRARNA